MARPMNPPSNAPAMPSRTVTMKPPGSRPGIRSLAMIPTISPKKIHARIPIVTPSLPTLDARPAIPSPSRVAEPCVCNPAVRPYSVHGEGAVTEAATVKGRTWADTWAGTSDEELAGRIRNGESALYEVLMRRYNQRLYRVACATRAGVAGASVFELHL